MNDNNNKNAAERLSEFNDILKENDNLYAGLAHRLGLSETVFWILYVLQSHFSEPVPSKICACLYLPKQTVHSALKKMEAEGYITCAAGSDRRSRRISLTEKGKQLCEATVDRVILAERSAIRSLSEEEQELFLSLFRKYTSLLKDHFQPLSASGQEGEKHANPAI